MFHIYSEPLFPSSDLECPSSSPPSLAGLSLEESATDKAPDPSSEHVLEEEEENPVESSQEEEEKKRIVEGSQEEKKRIVESSQEEEENLVESSEEENLVESSEEEEEYDLSTVAVRASALIQDSLTTGCPNLDQVLKGGIPAFGVTELFGDAGSGKTQICLQLAVTAQLSKKYRGLDSGVLYICTEDVFPSKRLDELIFHFKKRFPAALPTNPMNHVFVEHVADPDDLMTCLDVKLEALARQSDKKIRLVILDSVAGIFRTELDDFEKRTMGLRQLGQTLHTFSHTHKAAIIVCNQVTANLQAGGNVAALGMVWKNIVTNRIEISKSDNHQYRFLKTLFSPHIPKKEVSFQINANGVQSSLIV